MSTGSVERIYITHEAQAKMESMIEVRAIPGQGLEGDRYACHRGTFSASPGTGREVTLIEAEALEGLLHDHGIHMAPDKTRRNLVTRGVALNHLVDREFLVGGVRLRGARLCEPCDHLEALTQKGVRKGLVHRGGLRADIVSGGTIRVGDPVVAGRDLELHTNKTLIRRYYDTLWNAWDFEAATELLAPDLRFRGSLGVDLQGIEAFRRYMQLLREAFPDFHNAIQDLLAEGDQVAARLRYTGTHKGPLFDLAPTGRKIAYDGSALFRIARGRITEGWVLGDTAALRRQIEAR
jgi:steroid delta-isomerase-like uncharacterized protein